MNAQSRVIWAPKGNVTDTLAEGWRQITHVCFVQPDAAPNALVVSVARRAGIAIAEAPAHVIKVICHTFISL